jgi:hypothetical protein
MSIFFVIIYIVGDRVYIYDELKKYKDKRIKIYSDMDGVLADYDVGNFGAFDKKRPLLANIKVLEELSNEFNIEYHILSICHGAHQIDEKSGWLDKYAPIFKKENRNIIAKDLIEDKDSAHIKKVFLNNIKTDDDSVIVLIDDDPSVLHMIRKDNKNNAILLKDTTLIR